jgi:hypothetical protein
MQRLLLIALICSFVKAYAQLTVDSLFIPAPGTSLSYKSCDTTGINAGPSGPGQIFDYHTLAVTGTSLTNYIDAAGTPGYTSFPTATLAINLGSFTKYYRTTSDSFLYIGGFNNSSSAVNDSWNYGLNMQLPVLQYDSLYIDTALMSYYTPGPVDRIVIKKWKFDAYGQLLLPTGSYDTVYRIWSETEFHDASNFSFIPEHYIEYSFIPALLKYSVFSIQYGQSGSLNFKNVKYTESVAGISDIHEDHSLVVYPNPFSTSLYLSSLNELRIENIQLINLLGVKSFDKNFSSNPTVLEFTEPIAPGIYLMNVQTDKGSYRLKVIKQ